MRLKVWLSAEILLLVGFCFSSLLSGRAQKGLPVIFSVIHWDDCGFDRCINIVRKGLMSDQQ